MGCRDDLMYLTINDLFVRLIASDSANADHVRQVRSLQAELRCAEQHNESLRSELRDAQDSLAKLEAKKEAEPLPTWTPWPWLPDGEYERKSRKVDMTDLLHCCNSRRAFELDWNRRMRGYTSDPTVGRWQVKDGKATYLGEA